MNVLGATHGDAALRDALCRLGRSLYDRGLTHGSTGNLSVRTERGFLMTPTGASLGALDPARHESFLNLENEIAALKKRAEKRRMAVERWAKRSHRVKARNLEDRIQLERDERGDV